MIVAAIDIGTNTVLLLVAELNSQGRIVPLLSEQRIPRLGQGVDSRHRLHPDAMMRVVSVLLEYRRVIASYNPRKIAVFGTSAVRDAANSADFADIIRRTTGFDLEVLSGHDEALWTYRGALSGVPEISSATVVDIGGGSTEITWGENGAIAHSQSVNIGSVRLTERYLRHDPPITEEIDAVRMSVQKALKELPSCPPSGSTLIAVAGTATTLALLDQHRSEFSLDAVSGYRMARDAIHELAATLSGMPASSIAAMGGYMAGRSDIITAGALILGEVVSWGSFSEMVVSERGVRYGIALREFAGATRGKISSPSSA